MVPVEVKTVSNKRLSVETEMLALPAVIKPSFLQEISKKKASIQYIKGRALYLFILILYGVLFVFRLFVKIRDSFYSVVAAQAKPAILTDAGEP